tara:strand:- start:793 stop:1041 length:249 start_codon:yes stop_codon:yes gene_type:complete
MWVKSDFGFVRSLFLNPGSWPADRGTVEQYKSFFEKFKIKKSFCKKEVWQCSILLELLKNITKPVHSSIFGSVDSVPYSLGS